MPSTGCSTYKTYCGYCGTETGTKTSALCPTTITDTVPNTGTQYFAAFPIGSFGQGTYCGMCVQVTYMSKTITATIVDECATCPTAGHIDLSLAGALALGLDTGGSTADPTSGVTWKAVDCPVTGNIVAIFNGSSQEIYFQNVAFPVAQAVAGGHTATQQSAFWNFGTAVGGQSVTLTDTVGHVVTGTIPSSSGGSVGVQFPLTCQ
jgi:expansin (peptidoglycan-binding protein)